MHGSQRVKAFIEAPCGQFRSLNRHFFLTAVVAPHTSHSVLSSRLAFHGHRRL